MDIIEKFGNVVGNEALKDSDKARRLLLAGYRLQEKKLQLFRTGSFRCPGSMRHRWL